MQDEPMLLSYARPRKERHPYFHIFVMPLLWLPAGIGSRVYSHDIQLLVFLPGAPLIVFLQDHLKITTRFNIALFITLLAVIAAGHLLDRVLAPRWIYLAFLPILLLVIGSRMFVAKFRTGLQSIPPPPMPGPWHPSNLFPAWACTLCLFAIAAILLTALIRSVLGLRSAP
jgi:hypothetical protein